MEAQCESCFAMEPYPALIKTGWRMVAKLSNYTSPNGSPYLNSFTISKPKLRCGGCHNNDKELMAVYGGCNMKVYDAGTAECSSFINAYSAIFAQANIDKDAKDKNGNPSFYILDDLMAKTKDGISHHDAVEIRHELMKMGSINANHIYKEATSYSKAAAQQTSDDMDIAVDQYNELDSFCQSLDAHAPPALPLPDLSPTEPPKSTNSSPKKPKYKKKSKICSDQAFESAFGSDPFKSALTENTNSSSIDTPPPQQPAASKKKIKAGPRSKHEVTHLVLWMEKNYPKKGQILAEHMEEQNLCGFMKSRGYPERSAAANAQLYVYVFHLYDLHASVCCIQLEQRGHHLPQQAYQTNDCQRRSTKESKESNYEH